MKEKFKKLKETWKDPKGKAIIELCLWGLFFLIIILITFINNLFNSSTEEIKTYSYASSDNYEYKMTINYNNGTDEILEINGIRYQEKEVFYINEKEYFIENNIISPNINNELIFDILKTRPDSISNFINNKEYKETKYKDGTTKLEYTLKANEFNILNNNYTLDDENIKLDIIMTNSKVTEVDIDLTNMIKQVNSKTNNYQIKIEYSNIDNISNFTINNQQ